MQTCPSTPWHKPNFTASNCHRKKTLAIYFKSLHAISPTVGAWQFRRVFWVGFSLEGQEILDLGLRWLAEHLRGGFIFPLD
ncbi:MAG: hypothetical protein PHV34_06360, partial [Verrucomicrobiae bacterium]|nr:hypothetical protein [Verrucomicrobiae bacterium]